MVVNYLAEKLGNILKKSAKMGDNAPPPLMGATAIRPPERKGAEAYTYLLYDPKNGTILTRTPKSWGLIILFYCIYYSCLAAFWLACMKILKR